MEDVQQQGSESDSQKENFNTNNIINESRISNL